MSRKILITVGLMVTLSLGFEGLYGVINGGTIHQFTPAPYADADWIYFSNGIKFDVRKGEPELPQSLRIEKSNYYIVHCKGPVYPEYIRRMEASRAKVYSYLPNHAFLVKMDEITKNEIEHIEFVDWIGIYHPAYKISGQDEFKTLQGVRKVTVLLYADAEFDGVIDFLDRIGAKITDTAESKWDKLINCEVDLSHIPEIAKIEEVNWVEPWHETELHNSNVQWILQTCSSGNRRVWNMGIRGEDELVSICDTGIRTSHYAFRNTTSGWITNWGDYPNDRKVIAYKQSTASCDFGDEPYYGFYHGTHTSGTACGDDSIMSTDLRDGVAIKSRVYFVDGGDAASPGYIILPSNLNSLYIMPYNGNAAGSVKIMSNSWGSPSGGYYNASCVQTDQFMWDHKDFLLFFSNGNSGPGANTVGSPASAKNPVSVGGCQNGAGYQLIYSISSRGPTDDGRYKPTIIAPAQTVYSAYGGNNTGYVGGEGTSMASPGAAGAGVLMRQYFTDGWYPSGSPNPADSFAPSAALMKAMLVVSADPSVSGYTNVPNNNIGWGRIDLDSVLYFAGDTKKLAIVDDTTGLSTGQYVEYTYDVISSSEPFRVALVWTDYPGTTGGGIKLINDLHLTVTDPSSNQYKGNVYSGGQSTTGGSYDVLNVEECVRRNSPGTGHWVVRVEANNCPYGPQPFALVVTGDIDITAQPDVVYESHTIDDSGGNNNGRVDPGETVYITVTLKNDGDAAANNATGKLRHSSTYITLLDSVADYGTITSGGGTAQGTFQFSASGSTPQGTIIPMTVYLTANGGTYGANCNFNILIGDVPQQDYVTHDCGNCKLTVTRYGAIGYMNSNQTGGQGFWYPIATGSHLFYGSFAAGTDVSYCVDRYYEQNQSDDDDWNTTPDGMCRMYEPGPSNFDEYATARYDDSGHPSPKGLVCAQTSWAWDDPTANDFVIVKFVLDNEGTTAINDIYAAVFMDWDMMPVDTLDYGSSEAARNLTWMYRTTPYVGVAILDPPRTTPAANLSLIDHNIYVYPYEGLPDSIQIKFMDGTYTNSSSNRPYDWSTCNSAGPFTIAPGEAAIAAFAILGGDDLNDLQANADTAYDRYWNWPGVREQSSDIVIAGIKIYPMISRGRPYTLYYNLAEEVPVRVKLYDALGRLVKNTNYGMLRGSGELSLSLKYLAQGIYFVKIEADDKTHTSKVIWLR